MIMIFIAAIFYIVTIVSVGLAYSSMARFRRESFEIKYRDTLLSPAAPGYGGHWASCLARGQIRCCRGGTWPVKDAYPETNSCSR